MLYGFNFTKLGLFSILIFTYASACNYQFLQFQVCGAHPIKFIVTRENHQKGLKDNHG